jgi:SAM-dependent methyltransferase
MLRLETFEILACPTCKHGFAPGTRLSCEKCGIEYPVVNDVPVLIADSRSLFSVSDFVEKRKTTYGNPARGWKKLVLRVMPSISLNLGSKENFDLFFRKALEIKQAPRVLIIGGAIEGQGLDTSTIDPAIELVETDVAFGSRTGLICDAHDLPFVDGSFDGVIAQAVLEHVVDPFRCVNEIERVLAPDGIVYAETPFMQQVHMGRFDFLRFSHLGHRKLFQHFSELSSGPLAGPGTALAWAYAFLLRSFFTSKNLQNAGFAFGSFTGFWLKYLDHFLIHKPGTIDAASAFYFMGQKSGETLDDRKLIAGYRGALQ